MYSNSRLQYRPTAPLQYHWPVREFWPIGPFWGCYKEQSFLGVRKSLLGLV
jgi:hypothetical protein